MPITAGDVLHYESASTGSTGGAITGTTIPSNVKNNVWDDILDAARIAGGTTYIKTFWKNNNASESALVPVLYTPVLPTNMTIQLGLGINSSNDADSAQGNMTAFGANALVEVLSDGADTRTVTILGMNNAGTPVPTLEQLTLNGTTPVVSVATFSKVWGVYLSATSASRIVTVRQGVSGTTRGTIGLNKIICWLWVTASSKGAGIALPNLAPLANYGVWRKLSWAAAAGAVKPNSLTVTIEENS